ncbi:zinc finger protein KNUCKLES-like [Musa acuminata AAA Group]|uniref:zinc finger protein KNUCKLES-like n=1 Tax=Musa acuminata AAA Group TaxID=214697 RepID=UPI0031D9E791
MAGKKLRMDHTEGRRGFSCQFCDRIFPSKQAFGGHQNSHRKEREAVKRAKTDVPLFPALSGINVHKLFPFSSSSNKRKYDCLGAFPENEPSKHDPTMRFEEEDRLQTTMGGSSSLMHNPSDVKNGGDQDEDEIDLTLHL